MFRSDVFRKITRVFLFCFLLIMFIGCFEGIYAFGYSGMKWPVSQVHWKYNQNGQEGCTSPVDSVRAATQSWNDVECSGFQFIYDGLSTRFNPDSMDDENTIAWGTASAGSWIGVTFIWGAGVIYECDMFLNKSFSWSCTCQAGRMDVQNISTHEFGHFLSLDDLYSGSDSDKTMYGYSGAGECFKRTLHQDDMDGCSYIYPGVPLPGPPWPIFCLSSNTVIDGDFTTSEWDGADKTYIASGCSVSFPYYNYVANDNRFYYVCIDAVGDETDTGAHLCGIYFDTGSDLVLTTGSEDALEVTKSGAVYYKLYNGSGYDIYQTWSSGVAFRDTGRDDAGTIVAHGFGTSDNSSTPHHIYEFKIPMELGDVNTAMGDKVSYYVYMLSGINESYWPAHTDWENPGYYGKIRMATGCSSLPTTPVLTWFPLILSMLSLAILTFYRRL